MNYSIEEQATIGEEIATLLMLKKNKTTGRYQTTWGDKTAVGVFNTIKRLAEDIQNNKTISA